MKTTKAAERKLLVGGVEGAAGEGVDPDKEDGGDDEGDGGPAPLRSEAPQQRPLAGGAVVAEAAVLASPQQAVRARRWLARVYPQRRVHVLVSAHRRRLAATGLRRGVRTM